MGNAGQLISPPPNTPLPRTIILINRENNELNFYMVGREAAKRYREIEWAGKVLPDARIELNGAIKQLAGNRAPTIWPYKDDLGMCYPPHDVVIAKNNKSAPSNGIPCEFTIDNEVIVPSTSSEANGFGFILCPMGMQLEIQCQTDAGTCVVARVDEVGGISPAKEFSHLGLESDEKWRWAPVYSDRKGAVVPKRGTLSRGFCPGNDSGTFYDRATGEPIILPVLTVD